MAVETKDAAPAEEPAEAQSRLPAATRDAIKAAMTKMQQAEEAAPEEVEAEGSQEAEAAEAEGETSSERKEAGLEDKPDAKFAEAWTRLQESQREVDEERKRLRGLDGRVKAIDSASDDYKADRLAAVRKLVGGYLGTEDPAAIDSELQSLYEDWTGQILGTRGKSGSQPSELSKLRREFAETKRRLDETEAQRERERLEAEQARQFESAVSDCANYLTEKKDAFPFLAAGSEALGEKPGAVLWQWVQRAQSAGQTDLTLEEVAGAADKWFADMADRFRPLLAPEQGSPPRTKPAPLAKPGARKQLPTTRATETPSQKPNPYDPDQSSSRASAWKLMQRAVKPD